MKKCPRSRDACNRNITNHIFKQQTVFSVRFVQTFGSGDKKLGGIRGKIAYLLTLETFQYAIWFVGCMCLVFLTAAISQKHKYKDSSYFTGHASLMDVDQLESLKNTKKGGKEDKKGLDDIIDELYDKHIANKDLNDWENIRTPRPEEPDTVEANQDKRAAMINKKTDEEAKEFTSGDFGKIEETDISLDFDDEEVIITGGQLKYYGKVGGVKLPQINQRYR